MPFQREDIQVANGQSFRLLRWDCDVNKVEMVVVPGQNVAILGQGDHWHYHPASELTYIHRGSGTRFVADHIELFEAGDVVLIGPNVPHYWHMRGRSAGIAIQWDFPLDHGIWDLNETACLRALTESARRGLHVRGLTAAITRRRMVELPSLAHLDRLAAFLRILAGLVDAPEGDLSPLSPRSFSLTGSAETQDAIGRAVSYIVANYREQLHLAELLRLTAMSRATFARQFSVHAGKSFSAFRNQVRLQAICYALRNTSEPVGNIALNHGFNQLSFFNRLFRREIGVSPRVYRLKSRK